MSWNIWTILSGCSILNVCRDYKESKPTILSTVNSSPCASTSLSVLATWRQWSNWKAPLVWEHSSHATNAMWLLSGTCGPLSQRARHIMSLSQCLAKKRTACQLRFSRTCALTGNLRRHTINWIQQEARRNESVSGERLVSAIPASSHCCHPSTWCSQYHMASCTQSASTYSEH